MMRVIIDTDVFVDQLRGIEKRAGDLFAKIQQNKITAFASAVTVAELFAGKECENEEDRKAVEELLELVSVVDITEKTGTIAGYFRRKYVVATTDALIAATAHEHNIPLLTRNRKDFEKIKEIKTRIPY